jgi:hypothetical protein
MTGEYQPVAVEIAVAEPGASDLEDLVAVASEREGLVVGPIREAPDARDLFFDVGTAVVVVHSVTAVITGVGGAAKVIDWALTKLRERRGQTIVLRAGATTVTVKTGDDPERTRQLLEAALHAV